MNLSQVTAVILAGGLGTRLRSVVGDRPKVLAPIFGKPFISYLLDQLSGAGVQYTVLCVGYLGASVRAFLGDGYGSMCLVYSQEPAPLGTGGALRLAEGLFKSDHILVMNGDSYCNADLTKFLDWHTGKGSKATLLLTNVSDAGRYGLVRTADSGAVECFTEKGEEPGPGWVNAGVYLLNRDFIASIPQGRSVSLEQDIFPRWIGCDMFGYRSEGYFIDIGIPEDYKMAGEFFKGRSGH